MQKSSNSTLSAGCRPLSAVRRPLSAVRCPLSAVRCPLSAVRCPLSAVRCPSAVCSPLLLSLRCMLSAQNQNSPNLQAASKTA